MSIRPIQRLVKAKPTMEGAGVHLNAPSGSAQPTTSIRSSLDDFRKTTPTTTWPGSLAPTPRHRDHHLRARGNRRAWRLLGDRGAIAPGTSSG
jgi:hypothetical protein